MSTMNAEDAVIKNEYPEHKSLPEPLINQNYCVLLINGVFYP